MNSWEGHINSLESSSIICNLNKIIIKHQTLRSINQSNWPILFKSVKVLKVKERLRYYHWRSQWHPTPVLLPGKSHGRRSLVGCSPWGCEESDMTERLHFHFSFHALEKEMATRSSVLTWRIPGTGEPGGLPSMGSHRVEHDWNDLAAAAAARYYHRLENTIETWLLNTA